MQAILYIGTIFANIDIKRFEKFTQFKCFIYVVCQYD